jgi:hypothetical protein
MDGLASALGNLRVFPRECPHGANATQQGESAEHSPETSSGSHLGTRSRVRGSEDLRATLEDVRIEQVRTPLCPFEDCDSGSVGLFAIGAATATVDGRFVRDVDSAGVLSLDESSVVISRGYVAEAPFRAAGEDENATRALHEQTVSSTCSMGDVPWTPIPF